MPDYSKAKIYALRSHQTDDVYIGSTCLALSQRLADHKDAKKVWERGQRGYLSSIYMLDFDDCYIELIEEYPCQNIEQLRKREGEYIRANATACNKRLAGRTPKVYNDEYRKNNTKYKEAHLKYNKEWIEKNREYYNAYYRARYAKKRAANQDSSPCRCESATDNPRPPSLASE